MNECKLCKRKEELRMGYCFDCVDCECIIEEGTNMFGEEIETEKGLTNGMTKLKYILLKYMNL